jgi:chromosome segregation protein
MKLKKLEITGFKSFFDRISIDFPEGISAVVGPNGCGKSNIIDALRWVMGEQSVKQLRGKSMEDVIFSGANGKLPLNMAEVSLTLNNDNGNAPEELKDFTEINLTRRLYRSGESAYFLNKRSCRLKDIYNVFLGSGLGAKSYAIIQQGNIGAITEAGPEERRFFIEEAAGVSRFKSRKTEALRKMEMTRQNLLRVSDILTEIKRQMGSLKRQARKAEIYNNYQHRIKILDIKLGIHYSDTLTRRIEETDRLLTELKDKDLSHSSELQKLDAAVEEVKIKRWQKNQEISEQKAQRYETQRTIDRVENDLTHLRGEIERLSTESAELRVARENLIVRNHDIISEIGHVEAQNQKCQDEIRLSQDELNRERRHSEKVAADLYQIGQQLESKKSGLMDLVAQEAQYKNIYQTAVNNKESLHRRLRQSEREESNARTRIAEVRAKETQAHKDLEEIRRKIADLGQQIDDLRQSLDNRKIELSDQVKTAQKLELEHNTIRSKLTTLKKMEDNFEWYKDGVRAVMKRAGLTGAETEIETDDRKAELKGVVSLLAEVLDTEPSFETAVEAALGESLQFIIVEDQHAGLGVIDYLQNSHAGRCGMIPISSLKPPQATHDAPRDSDHRLLQHVRAKAGFEKIAEVLLGHVIYADTLEEAVGLFNQNGISRSIVTRDGHVISPSGIMVGGSKDRLNGILSKKHELQEQQRQARDIEKRLTAARERQANLESEVRRLESDYQQHLELKNQAAQQEMEAEKELYRVSENLKNAQRHLEIISLEKEQLQGEATDAESEMTKYDAALNDIAADIKRAQNEVTEMTEASNQVAAELEQIEQQVVDLKLRLTASEAKLENTSSSLRRLREFQSEGSKQLDQLSNEIGQKHHKETAARQKISEYEQKLAQLYQDLNTLEVAIQENEADYQAIDAQIQQSDEKMINIKGEREKTNEKLRVVELEQSQHKMKQEHVINRLEDRYQSPFTDLKAELDRHGRDAEAFADMTVEELETELSNSRDKVAKIQDVNLAAIREYEELKERYDFLDQQRQDLDKAIEDLQTVIKKINKITQERFMQTFAFINEKLKEVFPRLFDGGSAKLVLSDPEKPLETGVGFLVQPPGKKLTRMSLLSGGEKALAAIAFVFSIFLIKPASFCLLDEIDAPLDDANIFRFNNLLKLIGEKSQIIMVTHNKHTMEFADMLFGITMEEKGISKLVSVNLKPGGTAN